MNLSQKITKKKVTRLIRRVTLLFTCLTVAGIALGQSNYKEASNNFALYTQTGDLKHLENAKKFVDAGYVTKRDTTSARMNVIRSMVYSSIAYADSTKKIKTDKDPINVALLALNKLRDRDREAYAGELSYITQNLAAAYIYNANQALNKKDYTNAYNLFQSVKEMQPDNEDVLYNLALLAVQADKMDDAVNYYNQVIKSDARQAAQYLELAAVHKNRNSPNQAIKVLEEGRQHFPDNKDILFELIQSYRTADAYDAIVPIVDQALKYEPENVDLNYLAGFSEENAGNKTKAAEHYKKTIELDPDNYEANLALGLLNLNDFLTNTENHEAQYNAQSLLLKANEVRPYEINALKSLALLYENANDDMQLDRVNMLLNHIQNN